MVLELMHLSGVGHLQLLSQPANYLIVTKIGEAWAMAD